MIKFSWSYRGEVYTSRVQSRCPICRAYAIVKLPPAIAREQTDGTTHVCHPSAGGCNHGFSEAPRRRGAA
jgi:hypothetical protein